MNIDKTIVKVRDAIDTSLAADNLPRANWNDEFIVIPPRTSMYDIFTVPSKSFEMGSNTGSSVFGRLVRVTVIVGTAYSVGYIKGHIKGVRKARRENVESRHNGK